jgi:glycosyltransferase involved in cell wall biosynthesis
VRRQVLLNWKAGTTFGWGLLGFGIALHWGSDPDIQAIMGLPMGPNDFPCMDPVRAMALGPTVLASQQFLSELEMGRLNLRESRVMVMDALSNGFLGPNLQHYGLHNVGRCVFEDTRVEAARHRLTKYDSLLCASHWNAGMLQAISNRPVAMLHEGVDQSQFFPGPKSGLLDPNRFYVFSGGKIEFRKAHDLVLLAFREFAARHDDVVLVGAWHSPWPQVSAGFQGKALAPLNRDSRGELDLQRWVSDNGIPAGQFIELPRMPNSMMPGILREMDCAVQISRCEPCTNLPAKEAMACGVPVILADNTGTRDLIDTDNCLALRSQGIVAGPVDVGTDGWGETSVDELVTAFEALYSDTQRRKRIGARGAQWIIEHQRTWRDHASSLKHHLLRLFGAA